MKRHMRLIRKILEWAEQRCNGEPIHPPDCSDHDTRVVNYHVGLCEEAGYLRIEKISGAEESSPRFVMGTLTWAGHEALERLRENC